MCNIERKEDEEMERNIHKRELRFTLQWHTTTRCEQNCVYCYRDDRKSEYELSYKTCIKIIDDLKQTFDRWRIPVRINFTGGDPLLRKDALALIKYATKKGILVGILGNPNRLDYRLAKKLKNLGVFRYQISIDGLSETHDKLRGRKGLFEDSIRAIHILEEVGIPSVVMFTLSKVNAHELIEVIRIVAKEGVSVFDFSRLVPTGRGQQFKEQMLESREYRNLLLQVLEEYKHLKENGCKTYFGRKDPLWKLLYQELGLLSPLQKDRKTIYTGCGIGSTLLVISADGTIYPCRRLPIPLGRLPQQSIREIFINSPKLNEMRKVEKRKVENMKKCKKCEVLPFCRGGCPAISYAVYGDYTAPDPQCWKEVK